MTAESPVPFATSPAERVATIVNSYLQGGGFSGAMGALQIIERAQVGRIFLVSPTDAPRCAVWPSAVGWNVSRFTLDDNPMPPTRHHHLEVATRLAYGESPA